MMKKVISLTLSLISLLAVGHTQDLSGRLKHYVEQFNARDTETVRNLVGNEQAVQWMLSNVPTFTCPDTLLERIYYYRWWTFRKHLKQTPDGYVFTEFIINMPHGGKYNTISSALGHHIYEGRWLRDTAYISQYMHFWLYTDPLTPKPHLHNFSSWLQNAYYEFNLLHPDAGRVKNDLAALDKDYRQWITEKQNADGRFWQFDVRDAMEESISGGRKEKNVRPTINSYMYGNAVAMAKMAELSGNTALQAYYDSSAAAQKKIVQDYLWNDTAGFFEVRKENGQFAGAREAIGFIPWYFGLPDDEAKYSDAWEQLKDSTGFSAPWGITTAERRHPGFRTHGSGHGCEWDGAVWPYATSQTMKGLANLLRDYRNKDGMSKALFYSQLRTYAHMHQKNGLTYLGEYQDEKTGEWLKGDNPRSSYYNHSTYVDIVISDLIGVRPQADGSLLLQPLLPEKQWDWFALKDVNYQGLNLDIIYDKKGKKFGKGKGLMIYVNGQQVYRQKKLGTVRLDATKLHAHA